MERKISFSSAIRMNINIMIGAGIFILPRMMAKQAGALSYLGWGAVALIFLPVVYSIAQVTKLFPEQGSFYNYSKKGIGRKAGYISGLVYFLGYVSIISLQTHALRSILATQLNLTLISDYPLLFNALFITAICSLNFLSLRVVSRLQNSGVLFKLAPILVAVVALPFVWNMDLPVFDFNNLNGVILTVPIALFGYWGFESCASISHLIEGDSNNASKAILYGFFITAAIYTLFHISILHILGPQALEAQGVAAFAKYLPLGLPILNKFLALLISASICVALISAVFGEFISNSALINAMAKEQLFFGSTFVAQTTSTGLPWAGLVVQAASCFVVMSLVTNEYVLNAMSNFGLIGAFVLTLISLIGIQLKKSERFGPVVSVTALASCMLLTCYSWNMIGDTHFVRLVSCIPFAGLIAGGLVLYFIHPANKEA